MSQLVWLLLVAFLGLFVFVAVVAIRHAKKNDPGDAKSVMPRWKRITLVFYLVGFGMALLLMLISLASLDFPETPVAPREVSLPIPAPSPTATPAPATTAAVRTPNQPPPTTPASPTPVVPVLLRILPQSTLGSPPTAYLTLYGKNFSTTSKVRFNAERIQPEYLSDDLLKAQLRAEDLIGKGSVTVDVINQDGSVSNAITVPIEKPRAPLNVFFVWYPEITRELQLLLLVILAGAFGSYLHAMMSLADFIGSRNLITSWFWWYLTRPFLGMSMGIIFYAVLRGGFMVGTPADAKVVNPFGVLAIGALVGMFSDKAAQKLGEIFDVVFRSSTIRPDKMEKEQPNGNDDGNLNQNAATNANQNADPNANQNAAGNANRNAAGNENNNENG